MEEEADCFLKWTRNTPSEARRTYKSSKSSATDDAVLPSLFGTPLDLLMPRKLRKTKKQS